MTDTVAAYPHLLRTARPGLLAVPAQPGTHGFVHVGLEEAENGFGWMAAFYAERAAGGVGLIVTSRARQQARPWRQMGASPTTSAGRTSATWSPCRPRRGRSHRDADLLHFGRYAYHPELVAPKPDQAPISPFPPYG